MTSTPSIQYIDTSIQRLSSKKIAELAKQEKHWQLIDERIVSGQKDQYDFVTLCNSMLNDSVRPFVKPEEYDNFKQTFQEAKDWV